MPPAFLILDPQNDFFGSDNPNLTGFFATIPIINRAAGIFRQQHWQVIFLQHASLKKPVGSAAWQVYPAFERFSEDDFLAKTKTDAFEDPSLQSVLKTRGVNMLLLAGFLAEYCVLSTYHTALCLGYRARILRNGVASLDPTINLEEVDSGIQFLDIDGLESALRLFNHKTGTAEIRVT